MEPGVSLSRSVAKNVFFKGAGEILIRVISFAFVVLVARTLRASDFGALNFAYSFPLLFIVIADFGFNPLLVRELSRDPESSGRVFANFLALKLGLALLYAAAVGIGMAVVAPPPAQRTAVLLLAGFALLNSFTEFINAVFQSRQQMQIEAGVLTGQKLALLVFGLAALALGWGLNGVAGAYCAAGAFGLVVGAVWLARRGFVAGPWRLDAATLRAAFRDALPLTLTTLFVNLYFRIDMTILAKLRSAEEVGWYAAAHKCIEVLMLVPAVLAASTLPGFSKLFLTDRARLVAAVNSLLRLLLILGLPLAVGAALLGTPLMRLVYGDAFAPAGPALGWLAAALGFIFLNYPLSFVLISGQRQGVNAAVSGLAVAVSVGINFLLVPRYGYLGAAAAAVITEAVLFAAYALAVQRGLLALNLLAPLLRVAAAAAVMAVPVWLLRGAHPLLAIAAGAVVYAGALWLVRAVGPEDAAWLRGLLVRRDHA